MKNKEYWLEGEGQSDARESIRKAERPQKSIENAN